MQGIAIGAISELKPGAARRSVSIRTDVGGKGLVLVPNGFVWPGVMCTGSSDQQAIICYPPRGLGGLRPAGTERAGHPLGALMGRTRASLLAALELPATTRQRARRLDVTPAAVSQHLKVLKESALVESRRTGRIVLYRRTDVATRLVHAGRPTVPGGTPARRHED